MTRRTIPYDFSLRTYQREVFQARQRGVDRLLLVWPRRSGKDKLVANLLIYEALMKRVGNYYLIAPYYQQAKLIYWNSRDNDGKPFLFRHIPDELIERTNQQELSIDLTNGSRIQLLGSDNMNSVVGTNAVGLAFTEFAIQSPLAWQLFRPIIMANKGFAIFNSTPRGQNHFFKMYSHALDAKDWFCSYKTADDLFKDAPGEDGSSVIPPDEIHRAIREGMDPDLVKQEFYCDWRGYATGSYYGAMINALRDEGHLTVVPYDSNRRVFTAWDLAIGDNNAIVFAQADPGGTISLIDCIEDRGKPLGHYIKEVLQRPYKYSNHYAPHDIRAREYQSGQSRLNAAASLGINFRIVPNVSVEDGIDSVRRMLPRTRIDIARCSRVIDCLSNYRRKYDEKTNSYSNTPVHDEFSDVADAIRYLSLIVEDEADERRMMRPPRVVGMDEPIFESDEPEYRAERGRVSF